MTVMRYVVESFNCVYVVLTAVVYSISGFYFVCGCCTKLLWLRVDVEARCCPAFVVLILGKTSRSSSAFLSWSEGFPGEFVNNSDNPNLESYFCVCSSSLMKLSWDSKQIVASSSRSGSAFKCIKFPALSVLKSSNITENAAQKTYNQMQLHRVFLLSFLSF